MSTNIFIQARMSSSRYPGKVLAPFKEKPLIKHLIDQAAQVKNINKIVILTSTEESDNPLTAYIEHIEYSCFRGSLHNVFDRFQKSLEVYPCDYFVRLCADSPYLEPSLIDTILENTAHSKYDLISNIFDRKFPKGQSVEVIKSKTFLAIPHHILSNCEREHVTPYFYTHQKDFKTLSIKSKTDFSHINMCIDTLDDLKKLENWEIPYSFDRRQI